MACRNGQQRSERQAGLDLVDDPEGTEAVKGLGIVSNLAQDQSPDSAVGPHACWNGTLPRVVHVKLAVPSV